MEALVPVLLCSRRLERMAGEQVTKRSHPASQLGESVKSMVEGVRPHGAVGQAEEKQRYDLRY